MTKTPSSSFDILASLSPASSGAPRLNGADSRVSGIISLREVSKTYDLGEVRVEALKGLSLEITGGQFVAIMGASGSGKSTMLNILGCLDRPSSGVYLLDGVDVSTFGIEGKRAGRGSRTVLPEGNELPAPSPDFCGGTAELPRFAASPGGIRHLLPV